MNNSNNRNWAIEYATKLTAGAAGPTIMTVIETAWNNLAPSQQQDILDIYGREDYAAVAIPSTAPSHHTSQARTGGTKTTAKKTQHSNSTSQKSEPTSRA